MSVIACSGAKAGDFFEATSQASSPATPDTPNTGIDSGTTQTPAPTPSPAGDGGTDVTPPPVNKCTDEVEPNDTLQDATLIDDSFCGEITRTGINGDTDVALLRVPATAKRFSVDVEDVDARGEPDALTYEIITNNRRITNLNNIPVDKNAIYYLRVSAGLLEAAPIKYQVKITYDN